MMETSIGDQVLEIFKWIGIVFAAGLIGYFGRYLAMLIIKRLHKRKPKPPAEVGVKSGQEGAGTTKEMSEAERLTLREMEEAERQRKAEKKRLKLEAKRAKKEEKGK